MEVYLLRSDQKFWQHEKKRKQRSIFHFVLLIARNNGHDYLYKVPSFLIICQKFWNVFGHLGYRMSQ